MGTETLQMMFLDNSNLSWKASVETSSWFTYFLEKLMVSGWPSMEPEGSLPCLQQPCTLPYTFRSLTYYLNAVQILVRPWATQTRSASFRCFGLTGHHHVYKVCLRSLLCFPFDVLDASRCFVQVILGHAFVSNHVFHLCFVGYAAFNFSGVVSAVSD
jgi:hypothetical protein